MIAVYIPLTNEFLPRQGDSTAVRSRSLSLYVSFMLTLLMFAITFARMNCFFDYFQVLYKRARGNMGRSDRANKRQSLENQLEARFTSFVPVSLAGSGN